MTERILAVIWRLMAAAGVMWLAGVAIAPEPFFQLMAACALAAIFVGIPLVWVARRASAMRAVLFQRRLTARLEARLSASVLAG
jgi:hypothetical protein